MSKILLNYAVDFTQVSGTATTSLAFLHNMGVITAPSSVVVSATAGVPNGSTSIPATIDLTGYILEGTVLEVTTTVDAGSPIETPYTLTENQSPSDAATDWAALLNLEADLTAIAVGAQVQILVVDPAIEVVLTLVDANITGEIPLVSEIIEVVDPEDLPLYSDNPQDLIAAFEGGLSKVFVVIAVDILDVPALLLDRECDFFTLYADRSVTEAENLVAMAGWQGVKGLTFTVQADAEVAAAEVNTTAFFEDVDTPVTARAYFGIFSFASLLNANSWRNQQYLPVAAANGNPVTTLGLAESLFDDRISFYLTDPEQGTRLAFFVAGGLSITDPYIDMEIQVVTQSEMLNFIAGTQPYNIDVRRRQLEQIGNRILGGYVDAGLLDAAGINQVIIRTSNEAFIVNGEITTTNSEALWRVKIDALEAQAV